MRKPAVNFLLIILGGIFVFLLMAQSPVKAGTPEKHFDLNHVLNAGRFAELTDPGVREKLEENGFVVLENRSYDHFHSIYEKASRYDDLPVIVTADAVLHYYHVLYDYFLKSIEEEYLVKSLENMNLVLIKECINQEKSAPPELADIVKKNLAFAAVGEKLLNPGWEAPSQVKNLVDAEVGLIQRASGSAESPILGYKVNYGSFIPRGHYTRSETLKCYFRAMSWYGQSTFRFDKVGETQSVLLMIKAFRDSGKAAGSWEEVYEPTVLFVGESDDLTLYDTSLLINQIYGKNLTWKNISDDILRKKFALSAAALVDRKKKIYDPYASYQKKGFRLMGKRFVPDSYMLQQLVFSKVGTEEKPRLMPSGLDVMSVLGSERAGELQKGESKYKNYNIQIDKLKKEFAEIPADTWEQNLYWGWLNSLRPLLPKKDDKYPEFMQSKEWENKELNAALGSWAELRHDTILYVEASASECGEGAHFVPMKLAKGYVEPYPELYDRLAFLTRKTEVVLSKFGFLKKEEKKEDENTLGGIIDWKTMLNDYLGLVEHFAAISRKELDGKPLSGEEYNVIRNFGAVTEDIYMKSEKFCPCRGSYAPYRGMVENMALIADVHRDDLHKKTLEVGVGLAKEFLAIVPVDGHNVLAKGGVFSYYEFPWRGGPLTDEAWRDMLAAKNAPPRPEWTQGYAVNADFVKADKWGYPREGSGSEVSAQQLMSKKLHQISWGDGEFSPCWSPRYDEIIFFSKVGDYRQIFITRDDGSDRAQLSTEPYQHIDPVWNPWDCKIIYAADKRKEYELFIRDYDITEVFMVGEWADYPYNYKEKSLTEGFGNCYYPNAFHLFEKGAYRNDFAVALFFSSDHNGQSQLYKMIIPYSRGEKKPETPKTQYIATIPGENYQPSYSNGKIVFTSKRNGDEDIWTMDQYGQYIKRLTKTKGSDCFPRFSPDGTKIAFVSERSGNKDIWLMDTDGKNLKQLTSDPAADYTPWWSPCGTKIVFSSLRNGGVSHLWVMELEKEK
ncbi:MAG: DUF3160 domain-containing protein [Chloroflexi bacterium]|nr:DUF3160 domain-containing protein [Chloroflexota bacterium]